MMKRAGRRYASILLCVMILAMTLAGCSNNQNSVKSYKAQEITVITREDGSGTRGAFVDLFGVVDKNSSGQSEDATTLEAIVTNSTQGMMTMVSGDENAIGYISLGSLNSTVKTLRINGVEATAENVKNGSYEISRPFNIATKANVSAGASDFIAFIMSEEGQAVVEKTGYISSGNTGSFTSSNPSGKIVVAGSSSVTPVMEKLAEAYKAYNSSLTIEIQESDSTTGMTGTIEGTCDIGMASRELKESELSAGLVSTAIALDGIAVIVNWDNSISDFTTQQVQDIYKGVISNWSQFEE